MDWVLGTDQSLQDMLDCDIKSEIDSVIGGNPELGLNFTELTPLELDEEPVGLHSDLNSWFGPHSSFNGNSNSSNSTFNADLNICDAASRMVNPNSVMPHIAIRGSNTFPAAISNKFKKRSLLPKSYSEGMGNFTTSSIIKSTSQKRHFIFSQNLKKNHKEKQYSDTNVSLQRLKKSNSKQLREYSDGDLECENDASNSEDDEDSDFVNVTSKHYECGISLATNLEFSENRIVPSVLHDKKQQINNVINDSNSEESNLFQCKENVKHIYYTEDNSKDQNIFSSGHTQKQIDMQNSREVDNVNVNHKCLKKTEEEDVALNDFDDRIYPKPAYSYSCLIAMALKNSQTGSLPVSEIYNFMCEHFPYFKTAPNGWKNSVRHNLSLNKCFEKIEKPLGNGNQRKGCLWAINPAKISKMDEEVQKWSRKDPLAIKRAMIYPDQLELLERGEMKYVGIHNSDFSTEETESSADEAESADQLFSKQSVLLHSKVDIGLSDRLATNSVTDSYDESSQDCDLEINDQVYDEIELDEKKEAFHIKLRLASSSDENDLRYRALHSSNIKRRKNKISNTLQANCIYQPMNTSISDKMTPLYLRTAAVTGSFLKIE